jgi:hypothetical protein
MQSKPFSRFSFRFWTVLGLAGMVVLSMQPAVPAVTQAAQGIQVEVDKSRNLVTVDCDNVDFGLVLRAVFVRLGSVHIDLSRTAANGISGKVTVHLRNASVDTFLQTVLDQVGAEYTNTRNMYDVRRKGSTGPASGGNSSTRVAPALPVRSSESATPNAPVPPGTVPAAFKKRIGLVARSLPFETVLSQLGVKADVVLILSPEVPKNLLVSVRAVNEPLVDVIDKICRAAKLKRDITSERSATISPLSSVTVTIGGRDASGRCTNCRYDLKSDWQFCPSCGQRFGKQ